MRKATKALTTLICVCVLVCGCAVQQPEPSSLQPEPTNAALVGDLAEDFPLVSSPAVLNILSCGRDNVDMADVYVWQQYEQMTGVDVNWTTVSKDERAQAVYNALANKQNLDLIMRCKLSAARLTQYGEGGYIIDLAKDGLLQKNAPNCWAFLQSHPEALASIMNPDGTIYSLPQINSGAELRVSRKLFVNKLWLERVNMPLPTTTEELYELLKAFKEQDANGNGDPNDEIPLCSGDWMSLEEAFFGAFGLGNRGLHNFEVDCDETTGGVRLIAASDGYRDFLSYFNRLYSERLLDNYTFTMTGDQWDSNAANDLIGVFANTNLAMMPADKADNWVAIEQALEGPNGDRLWAAIRADFHSTGAAAIPTTCKNPALVLRWLDYFWTDEGTLFYHMGVEGETYERTADGGYDYMPFIYEQMKTENLSFDDVVARYSPYPGGSNPTVEIAPYFGGGEMAEVPASAARSLFEYGPTEYWPSFTFTSEESSELDSICGDIEKYTSTKQIEFITGAASLDDWDAYRSQLDRLQAPRMLEIYQAAVDRYHALGTVLQ